MHYALAPSPRVVEGPDVDDRGIRSRCIWIYVNVNGWKPHSVSTPSGQITAIVGRGAEARGQEVVFDL